MTVGIKLHLDEYGNLVNVEATCPQQAVPGLLFKAACAMAVVKLGPQPSIQVPNPELTNGLLKGK